MRRTSRIERLARHEERATVRRVVWLSIFSSALAIFIFTLGIPLLGKFADLLDAFFSNKNNSSVQTTTPQPPSLDDLPQATNSAAITISGFSSDAEKAFVFIDGNQVGEVKVEDSRFNFENFKLIEGENLISAKVKNSQEQTSDFSKTVQIIYDKEPPKLQIETPSEGETLYGNNRSRVSGTVDGDAQVFANGFLASINFDGKFEVFVPLAEGENTIEVKAVDLAGNVKTETRKVNFRK